jgi:hypothetical protein
MTNSEESPIGRNNQKQIKMKKYKTLLDFLKEKILFKALDAGR